MKFLLFLVAATVPFQPLSASTRTTWFEDARFGMFIHFGLYSIPAGVWNGRRMTRNDYAEWIRLQHDWQKPTSQLLRHLVDNASRGGNYQLNVGPTGEGLFQPAAIRRLREIGAWMEVNGSGIYGTRQAPFPEPSWGRLTLKTLPDGKQRLYAFVYDPEPGATLIVAGPAVPPAHGEMLETHEPISITATPGGFSFTLPAALPDDNIAVIAFE